jgi:hypothetical protein
MKAPEWMYKLNLVDFIMVSSDDNDDVYLYGNLWWGGE